MAEELVGHNSGEDYEAAQQRFISRTTLEMQKVLLAPQKSPELIVRLETCLGPCLPFRGGCSSAVHGFSLDSDWAVLLQP